MEHTVIINQAPVLSGKESIPDGALCGNGDLAAILGNSGNGLRIYLSKCDIWRATKIKSDNSGIKPVGCIDIDIPETLYKNYYVEQRMDDDCIFCRFKNGKDFIEVTITVVFGKNDVLIDIVSSGKESVGNVSLSVESKFSDYYAKDEIDDCEHHTNIYNDSDLIFPCEFSCAFRKVFASPTNQCYVFCVATAFDTDDYKNTPVIRAKKYNHQLAEEAKEHTKDEMHRILSKSEMHISDRTLEMNWYASQFHLTICTGNKKFPPGIYGNFITVSNPNWGGDYHLNYNYQAPFYAAFSSNHPEMTDAYHVPLEDMIDKGRKNAEKYLDCNGIYYPVGIGPKGWFSEKPADKTKYECLFLGQKSNASHAADIMIMRWYACREKDYAEKHLYPYLIELADFWESYLIKENGRYVITNDAVHEIPFYRDDFDRKKYMKDIEAKNNLLSLGLVRMVFTCLTDISQFLGKDESRREKWAEILRNLSDYPVFIKRGKRVFRYTENAMKWNNTNSLHIQHIYPLSQIGTYSDKRLLKTAKNTFSVNKRWFDGNATNSIFPCAVRLGINPEKIIRYLKKNYERFQLPNMLMLHGGGCLENCSLTASTINEMVLQGYEGIIRIFPNWDRKIDCSYKHLRADGGYLVSAECLNGEVKNIEIFCENKGFLKIENPYQKTSVAIKDKILISENKIITIEVNSGDYITLQKI